MFCTTHIMTRFFRVTPEETWVIETEAKLFHSAQVSLVTRQGSQFWCLCVYSTYSRDNASLFMRVFVMGNKSLSWSSGKRMELSVVGWHQVGWLFIVNIHSVAGVSEKTILLWIQRTTQEINMSNNAEESRLQTTSLSSKVISWGDKRQE